MDRAALRWSALVASLFATAGGIARADDGLADTPGLDERTAFLVGARTLKLGILAFDYGITNRVSIGSDPAYWAARAALPVLVPNLHVKGMIFQRAPVTVSGQVAGYYAELQTGQQGSGSVIAVPLSLFVSFRLHPKVWLHTEGAYVYDRAFGTGDFGQVNVGGAAASQTMQLGGMFQLRLTRVFSLTATGRYQVYTANLTFEGTSDLDPYTTASVNGRALPAAAHPWEAIGGLALLWTRVHLIVGAGYGYYFIPGVDFAYPKRTFVPDASFSVLL